MAKFETIEVTAPAHWASYLINGDASSFDYYGTAVEDMAAADAMVAEVGCGSPVGCSEEPFFARSADYMTKDEDGNPLAGDFLTYTFLKRTEGK